MIGRFRFARRDDPAPECVRAAFEFGETLHGRAFVPASGFDDADRSVFGPIIRKVGRGLDPNPLLTIFADDDRRGSDRPLTIAPAGRTLALDDNDFGVLSASSA